MRGTTGKCRSSSRASRIGHPRLTITPHSALAFEVRDDISKAWVRATDSELLGPRRTPEAEIKERPGDDGIDGYRAVPFAPILGCLGRWPWPTLPSPRSIHLLLACSTLLTLTAALDGADRSSPTADFDAARAVLERRCIECHGGDSRESGLSFADAASFAQGGSRGAVIDPSDLGASRLIQVIGYTDPDLAMPPSGVLPESEQAILTEWVLSGAPWPKDAEGRLADPDRHPRKENGAAPLGPWWAYDPLEPPPIPSVDDSRWSGHAVDALIHDRRTAEGLEPAPHADAIALLRRASYDLTGLPPTVDERASFEAAVASHGFDTAWSTLLARLLHSPAYAEHQARRWLDLVRYGETNGYERDAAKQNVWRYRDWVVRAYDRDLPYDEFARAQLAGDELDVELEGIGDSRLATGYFRLGVWDDEPADAEQARADELADIVDTTSQVFMATTLGCARCHDHKADPVSQAEYFGFTAHFAGLVGYGGGGFGQHLGAGATRDIPAPGRASLITAAERDSELEAIDAEIARLTGDLANHGQPGPGESLVTDARTRPAIWRYTVDPTPDDWTRAGFDDSSWNEGPGGFGTAITPGAVVGTEWRSGQIRLRTTFGLDAIPEHLRLTLHHDEDVTVWLNGERILQRNGYRTDYTSVQLDAEARSALVVGRNVVALECRQSDGDQFVDLGLDTRFDPQAEGARTVLLADLASRQDESGAAARQLLVRRAELESKPVRDPFPAQVAFERGGEPPLQFVHLRGSVHAPGDAVAPGIPAAWRLAGDGETRGYPLPQAPRGAPSSQRRSALVDWLFTDGAHLAARVEANRVWQSLFDRGLCRTPGDFGRLGERPTHPELLDHLAQVLIDRGWSRRALLEYVMSSETYRMAVVGDAAAERADPRNDHFWRQNPRRLTAEEYRDATLAVSGELNPERFGPSVFPPLPAEVLATASRPNQAWGSSSPEQSARRSLYVHVKRSLREPLLAALDQPDPDLPCPERFPTNVPTQALLTLNGDFTGARASAFARSLEVHADDPRARASSALERALSRRPSSEEIERAVALVDDLRNTHDLDDHGAWTLLALALFNRNEFLWID